MQRSLCQQSAYFPGLFFFFLWRTTFTLTLSLRPDRRGQTDSLTVSQRWREREGEKCPLSQCHRERGWHSVYVTRPVRSGRAPCNINSHLEQLWLRAWNIEQNSCHGSTAVLPACTVCYCGAKTHTHTQTDTNTHTGPSSLRKLNWKRSVSQSRILKGLEGSGNTLWLCRKVYDGMAFKSERWHIIKVHSVEICFMAYLHFVIF